MTWDPGAKDSSSRKVDRQVGPCLRLYHISGASLGLREYLPPWKSKSTINFSVGLFEQAHGLSKGLQSTIPGQTILLMVFEL